MSRLRVSLPPLHTLTADSRVSFARLERQAAVKTGPINEDQVKETGEASLMQLGQSPRAPALECFLHPEDSLLASIELPALAPAKVSAAVACAAQALILGQSENTYVAHSPRDSDGQVHISWLPREALARLGQVLEQAGLKLRGLYPAPYALPVPAAGQLTACLLEQHLLLRHGPRQGSVQPLPDDALQALLANGAGLQWVGEAAPAAALEQLPDSCRWTGQAPDWGLHGGVQRNTAGQQGWGRAAALCTAALLVWTLGLNLYAARQAAQGQQLKAQMSQRVQQVFPELPVILNPLQQARQQLAARQSGANGEDPYSFNSLLQQAGNAMPFVIGGVEQLDYRNGELQLSLLSDTRVPAPDSGWQGLLSQAGLQASAGDHGWTLRAASGTTSGAVPMEADDSEEDEDE
ncbi:type II secretion system protein GspL [Pseudomonas sp. NFIX28]|uniref:type II secretion system protein GspL n=1 Tax=Pseudomonas sp. NFIX28 TaxID=1566235 RepID=UPI000897E4C8|nr:type II secretion system protein GspL [Pseudomonas sp. NFIX28]SDZ62597.1 general secretion pathway protein L [Pseudomonas sp. NFIX28]